MSTDISQVFAPDKKTSQALTDSNELFQKILTDFEEDHDPETNLHKAPTFITDNNLTPPESGKARLQKTGAGQFSFLELGSTRTFSVSQIPTLQQAYASFSGTINPVTIPNQDNIASIVTPIPGQSTYDVTFANPLPNEAYSISAWAISTEIVAFNFTLKTASSFRLSFINVVGSPVSIITRANLTVFY